MDLSSILIAICLLILVGQGILLCLLSFIWHRLLLLDRRWSEMLGIGQHLIDNKIVQQGEIQIRRDHAHNFGVETSAKLGSLSTPQPNREELQR